MVLVGQRVEFVPGFPRGAAPGSYAKVPIGIDPRGDGFWYLVAPDGGAGAFSGATHRFTEHPDGTLTMSPSVVMPNGWHGFLRRGVWSQ